MTGIGSGIAAYYMSGLVDGQDRLYSQSSQPVEIDEDVREEYWTKTRGMDIDGKS
jgi:leucyl aminopeptidase (aminopeptidase T)